MSLTDFEVLAKLGEGSYSVVHKVLRKSDKHIYALKTVKLLQLNEKERENALNEVRILASIRHPNVVSYKQAFIDQSSNSLCIVMEYADDGDLLQKIRAKKHADLRFSESELWNFLVQAVRGLKALHDLRILHRDVKSANVFLCRDGTVKLGDLNASKVIKYGLASTQIGTPYYSSPEIWHGRSYDFKSDIWSLGCTIYEAITLELPFRANDMDGLYHTVVRGQFPPLPHLYSNHLSAVVRSLLQVHPSQRPNCSQILAKAGVRQPLAHLEGNRLLRTINWPLTVKALPARLPAPAYNQNVGDLTLPKGHRHSGGAPRQLDAGVRLIRRVDGPRLIRPLPLNSSLFSGRNRLLRCDTSAGRPNLYRAVQNIDKAVIQYPRLR